ncbi:hypothetical protein C0J52_27755 [Blattella germanica]|nr:hypothetical protein C0J52_27755 [Blattella germanica]
MSSLIQYFTQKNACEQEYERNVKSYYASNQKTTALEGRYVKNSDMKVVTSEVEFSGPPKRGVNDFIGCYKGRDPKLDFKLVDVCERCNCFCDFSSSDLISKIGKTNYATRNDYKLVVPKG